MKKNTIIFDIDGTLWNASAASAKGWNTGLTQLGVKKTVTAEQVEHVAGHPYEKCIDILLPGLCEEHPELPEILNHAEMKAVTTEGGRFYDGVITGIKTLAQTFNIFLVSNCQDWYMDVFLAFSGFKNVLSGLDCHGMSGLPKHDMLTNIINSYSLNRPVYIGDTDGDRSAAYSAGMDFIHVNYGFGPPIENELNVDSFRDLLHYFKSIKQTIKHL